MKDISKTADNNFLMSRRHSLYIFSLLFLLYMSDYIDRMVVVSLFPYFKADWGLSDTQCGLMVSVVYWSIVVFSFPASVIVDRWSRKKTIGIMALLWSIATASCAFTRNFGQLFVARTAVGIGEAGYAPGGTAMIAALFPERMRSMMVGLWTAALPIGSAIGIMVGAYIAARYGWRHAFGIVFRPVGEGLTAFFHGFEAEGFLVLAECSETTTNEGAGGDSGYGRPSGGCKECCRCH